MSDAATRTDSYTDLHDRIADAMTRALAIGREELPESAFLAPVDAWSAYIESHIGDDAEPNVPSSVYYFLFTSWALFDESQRLIDRLLEAPSIGAAGDLAMLREIAETVRWRNFAVEGADVAASTLDLRDLATDETFTVEVEPERAARRVEHSSGVVSTWFARVDGVYTDLIGMLYDRQSREASPVPDMTPIEALTSILFRFDVASY